MTAGRLAELMGLTTGAVTGVLDRLERAGCYAARPTLPTGAGWSPARSEGWSG